MAVIQISKIQIRRGQTGQEGLPTLASGELGWSIDEQRLFIGNGSVAEGAPAVGNTEILTETRMFELLRSTDSYTATNYTYRGHNASVSLTEPVTRTIQHKLDDVVSLNDFGVEDGDDITLALQKAIDELYLRSENKTKPSSRVPFVLPAGTFYTTSVVYVPPYATIIGAGIDKTVIISNNTSGNTTIFQTIDGSSTKVSRVTGLNIIQDTHPKHISISGMTLSYSTSTTVTNTTPLLQLDGVSDSVFKDIKFQGTYEHGGAVTTTNVAVVLTTPSPIWSRNISIEDCIFDSLSYPIRSDFDILDLNINSNHFLDLYQGITFATDLLTEAPKLYGPRRVHIDSNIFENIERQAIYAGANPGYNNQINSENNHFIGVGNGTTIGTTVDGDDSPDTSIISFLSHGNSTKNDNFQRAWYAQIDGVNKRQKPVIEGLALIESKYVDKRQLEVSGIPQNLIRIPFISTVTSILVEYTVDKDPLFHRKGSFVVVGGPSGLNYRDQYMIAGDGSTDDLVFNADFVDTEYLGNVDTLAVQYTNPTSTGTVFFTVSYYR